MCTKKLTIVTIVFCLFAVLAQTVNAHGFRRNAIVVGNGFNRNAIVVNRGFNRNAIVVNRGFGFNRNAIVVNRGFNNQAIILNGHAAQNIVAGQVFRQNFVVPQAQVNIAPAITLPVVQNHIVTPVQIQPQFIVQPQTIVNTAVPVRQTITTTVVPVYSNGVQLLQSFCR